ncbi:Clan SC, family S28, unassigned serine peptidase [Tritrichomonas foetus]|uniref:Clan SC, family S28, unassigned serine peptidase n=1 Tax=Tritrichomonas foetus TaxID=1144522 RepID=A0A1J4L6N9_9EUKA|nr:Clan SC, family S28, unassigned serine peptidase [Tritrichomonas foetus]|eukprot:OHT17614.1 Clan SC, family S28, unassigned serine peptidase [Tritrichomonas foetus]
MFIVFSLLFLRDPFTFEIIGDKKILSQKLDHFDSHSNETFNQIYYENRNYGGGNPKSIVIYLGSENIPDVQFNFSAMLLAEQTHSILYSLEHRFFGESFPDLQLETSNLQQYLTTRQVLNDIAYFINHIRNEVKCQNRECNITLVGGGYLGTLAAWFRIKYPHFAASVISSSSPMLINKTYPAFDSNVYDVYNERKPDCANLFYVLEYLYNLQDVEKFKEKFEFNQEQTAESFYYVVSEVVSLPMLYRRHFNLTGQICDQIMPSDIDSLASAFRIINNRFETTPQSLDPYSYKGSSLDSQYRNHRSWTWLKCSEIGLWHTASKDSKIKHPSVNETYFNNVCKTLFGRDLTVLDSIEYGNSDYTATNAVFINGNLDPYKNASLQFNNTGYHRSVYIIEGGFHCDDMLPYSNDNASIAREAAVHDIIEWGNQKQNPRKCENGIPIFGSCKCYKNFGGDDCEYKTHPQQSFKIITYLAVLVPTILLLIIGSAVWLCGKREESEIGARPTLYT